MEQRRILIEGIGSIGGVIAGHLIRAGYRLTLVTGNQEITDALNRDGLRVSTPEERFLVPCQAFTSLGELEPGDRFDLALLVMKAHSVVQAASETLKFLAPENGFVVTCQNGIVEDAVAEVVGPERVVAGIIGWGGTMHTPGVVERTGPGAIHIGELDGRRTERIMTLARILRTATPVMVTDNIRGARWSKLAINCTTTSIGALTGESLGSLLKEAPARQAFLGIYREVVDTAIALGMRLERIAADPMLLYLPENAGCFTRLLKDLLTRVVGRKYGKVKSSSLQSLQRGRKTEIEFLNGYVVNQALKVGVKTVLNERLTRMVREIEQGRRKPSPENLIELLSGPDATPAAPPA